ncbi:hypothetical protein BB934_23915 [Microvirga ossetica]|uniref:DUF1254 domain-containing protein n=1 Tax=Microvirga ossetica TaxID=1882682 RepID=A0A1B2ELN9_9HYPH|nr:DUF1254 domain-containing protein [Microvirga ossetica]ANY80898.1 hypothetical protein BB934_23915 [Microvirga ossetica]
MKTKSILAAALVCALGATAAHAQTAPKMKTDIPPEITTPDTVETRLGTLKFTDGFPDQATRDKVYDNLDFQRGVQAFLTGVPGASAAAIRAAIRKFGPDNQTVILFESLMDSKSLFLTANTENVYAWSWLNLKDGPMVLETPPNVLGIIDDFWFRYVSDFGNAGPDKGEGGKFLILPPGYKGDVPEGYHVARSPTFNNLIIMRGFLVDGSPTPAAESIKKIFRIYPLGKDASASKMNFVNSSGREMNSIHANNFSFFEELNQVVQEEPGSAMDLETLGMFAAIGIEKGQPFAPDARMKKILTEAAAVGNATARAITFDFRMKDAYLYPNSAWNTMMSIPGETYQYERDGVRLLDARSYFYYYATGNTPAMSKKMVGAGSQYVMAFKDADGHQLDGGKTYKLHLPPDIPVRDFWSLVVYDNQTRSMLQTDQQFPSMGSQKEGIVINPDTSADIYFGPTAPSGKEGNWVQTVPGKGWNVILRLYGPLEPFFDKTWRPGEIELVK